MNKRNIPVRRGHLTLSARNRRRGLIDGQRLGFRHGYRMGRCDKIVSQLPGPEDGFYWDIRVMLVPEGFPAIDNGVFEALRGLVREVHMVDPRDVPGNAALIRPDLLLVINGMHSFPADQADAVRNMGIKTAVWFSDDPYYTDLTVNIVLSYDYIFTHETSCIEFYKELGCPEVHHLPLAVNAGVFYPQRVGMQQRTEICFIGTAFWNRVELFNPISRYLAGKNVMISGGLWDRLDNYKLLADKIHLNRWMPPEETALYYNGAQIVINPHRSHDDVMHNKNSRNFPGQSINPRTYEIAACATLQLTDIRQELPDAYVPGQEIETYSSSDELVHKIEHYLSHEEERLEKALNGFRRTIRDHSYRKRVIRLLQVICG